MIHQVHLSKQTECNALCCNDECWVTWQEYVVHTESVHVERECLTNPIVLNYCASQSQNTKNTAQSYIIIGI